MNEYAVLAKWSYLPFHLFNYKSLLNTYFDLNSEKVILFIFIALMHSVVFNENAFGQWVTFQWTNNSQQCDLAFETVTVC